MNPVATDAERAAAVAANRAAFPQLAAAVDLFRAHFGPGVRLVYGIEDGRELGKKPPPRGGTVKAKTGGC